MHDSNYLFSNVNWLSVDQSQQQKLVAEINGMNGDRLLNTSVDDLCDYFEKKYWIEIPQLNLDGIVADQSEAQLDISRDFNRDTRDRSRPFHITGTAVEITVPFEGEADAFKIQPTSYTLNPPRAEVRDGAIVLRVIGTDLTAERVRQEIDRTLAEIQSYLTTLREDARKLNQQLKTIARTAIDRRRQKLLADRNLVVSPFNFEGSWDTSAAVSPVPAPR